MPFKPLAPGTACRHRKTKPYTLRTNGMVERFNGRVRQEVLRIIENTKGVSQPDTQSAVGRDPNPTHC